MAIRGRIRDLDARAQRMVGGIGGLERDIAGLAFSRSDRNLMMRTALNYAGRYWLNRYLPLRFTGYVYNAPFNYQLKTYRYINEKRKLGLPPLVSPRNDHEKLIQCAARARIGIKKTANGWRMQCHIPGANHINYGKAAIVRHVMRTVPIVEQNDMLAKAAHFLAAATAHGMLTGVRTQRQVLPANVRTAYRTFNRARLNG